MPHPWGNTENLTYCILISIFPVKKLVKSPHHHVPYFLINTIPSGGPKAAIIGIGKTRNGEIGNRKWETEKWRIDKEMSG